MVSQQGPRRTKTTSGTKQVSAGLLRLGSSHGLGLVGLGWQSVCTGSLVLQLGEISRKTACCGMPFPDAQITVWQFCTPPCHHTWATRQLHIPASWGQESGSPAPRRPDIVSPQPPEPNTRK